MSPFCCRPSCSGGARGYRPPGVVVLRHGAVRLPPTAALSMPPHVLPVVAVDLHLDVPGVGVVLRGDGGVRGLVCAVPPKGGSPRLDPALASLRWHHGTASTALRAPSQQYGRRRAGMIFQACTGSRALRRGRRQASAKNRAPNLCQRAGKASSYRCTTYSSEWLVDSTSSHNSHSPQLGQVAYCSTLLDLAR